MRAFLATHRAELLQIIGGAVLVLGVAFAFGYAVGLIVAGLGVTALGIAEERG